MLYHFGVSHSLPQFGSCFLSLSQSLCKSALMTTFPLRSRIFWIKSDFFNEFNADSDKFKIFVLLSPILNNLLKCPRREMKIIKGNAVRMFGIIVFTVVLQCWEKQRGDKFKQGVSLQCIVIFNLVKLDIHLEKIHTWKKFSS